MQAQGADSLLMPIPNSPSVAVLEPSAPSVSLEPTPQTIDRFVAAADRHDREAMQRILTEVGVYETVRVNQYETVQKLKLDDQGQIPTEQRQILQRLLLGRSAQNGMTALVAAIEPNREKTDSISPEFYTAGYLTALCVAAADETHSPTSLFDAPSGYGGRTVNATHLALHREQIWVLYLRQNCFNPDPRIPLDPPTKELVNLLNNLALYEYGAAGQVKRLIKERGADATHPDVLFAATEKPRHLEVLNCLLQNDANPSAVCTNPSSQRFGRTAFERINGTNYFAPILGSILKGRNPLLLSILAIILTDFAPPLQTLVHIGSVLATYGRPGLTRRMRENVINAALMDISSAMNVKDGNGNANAPTTPPPMVMPSPVLANPPPPPTPANTNASGMPSSTPTESLKGKGWLGKVAWVIVGGLGAAIGGVHLTGIKADFNFVSNGHMSLVHTGPTIINTTRAIRDEKTLSCLLDKYGLILAPDEGLVLDPKAKYPVVIVKGNEEKSTLILETQLAVCE